MFQTFCENRFWWVFILARHVTFILFSRRWKSRVLALALLRNSRIQHHLKYYWPNFSFIILGLPIKDLYSKSREQFLVSSELALRTQLTEFLDHKLVKIKRTLDGSENLVIPIEGSILQQFLEENTWCWIRVGVCFFFLSSQVLNT